MKFFTSILFSVVFVTVSSEQKLELPDPDHQKIHLREYKIEDNNGLHRVTRISLSEAKALGIDIEALKMGRHHVTALGGLPMTLVDNMDSNVRNQRNADNMNIFEPKNTLYSSQPRVRSLSLASPREREQSQPLKRFKRDDSGNSKTLKMDGKYARRVREQLQIFNNLQILRKSISAFI